MAEPWTTEKIREAFIYDGGEAEYHDPEHGAQTQRRIAGDIFDAWLAAHDAEKRAEWEAEHPDVAALREARAETWDEAVAAVFAWWSAPDSERPAVIVNPYGVGVPVNENGETP